MSEQPWSTYPPSDGQDGIADETSDTTAGDDWDAYPALPGTPDYDSVERYKYVLAVAPPQALEQAHFESLVALTDEQRGQLHDSLAASGVSAASGFGPEDLARSMTQAERQRPRTLAVALGLTGLRSSALPGDTLAAFLDGVVRSRAVAGLLGTLPNEDVSPRD